MLGAGRVPARTFHSAALAQLHYFAGSVGEVLASKASILLPIARSLPVPFRYRPLADLATEIEWAKNRRLTPDTYRRSLGDHEPPVPDDVMERVFRTYEARKTERGLIDFEDLLEHAVRMYDEDPNALRRVPGALPGVHGRRVPGREPAPAVAAGALGRRPRRPVRRRRRLPVDLLLHGRDAGVPARDAGAVPGRAGRAAGGELPLDAGDPVDGQPPGPGARRLGEGAAGGAPERPGAADAGAARPADGGGVHRLRRCAAWRARASRTRRWRSSTA